MAPDSLWITSPSDSRISNYGCAFIAGAIEAFGLITSFLTMIGYSSIKGFCLG
jgi:hypothetical protein